MKQKQMMFVPYRLQADYARPDTLSSCPARFTSEQSCLDGWRNPARPVVRAPVLLATMQAQIFTPMATCFTRLLRCTESTMFSLCSVTVLPLLLISAAASVIRLPAQLLDSSRNLTLPTAPTFNPLYELSDRLNS